MKKTNIIFRVSEEEKLYIQLKAKERDYTNLSDFIISSLIKPERLDKKKMKDMCYEVNKIGVNLNQITRKMHFSVDKTDKPTVEIFQEVLNEIKETNLRLDMVINAYKKI